MRTIIRAIASVVLFLSVILLSGCAEIPDAVQSRYSQPVGEIHGSRTVGQTFVSHEDGLSRIDVLLATYARKNTHPVTFRLKESPNAADDIAAITINAARVKDNAFHQFKFAPLPDSKDRAYFFAIESPESVPGNAITIWHDPDDAYDEGAMHVNGQATSGDLAFRTYYGGGLGDVANHHTIISQMIAERGMIPESYRPYISVDTFTYHFGFHSNVAFFHWITGLSIPQAVLVVG